MVICLSKSFIGEVCAVYVRVAAHDSAGTPQLDVVAGSVHLCLRWASASAILACTSWRERAASAPSLWVALLLPNPPAVPGLLPPMDPLPADILLTPAADTHQL